MSLSSICQVVNLSHPEENQLLTMPYILLGREALNARQPVKPFFIYTYAK